MSGNPPVSLVSRDTNISWVSASPALLQILGCRMGKTESFATGKMGREKKRGEDLTTADPVARGKAQAWVEFPFDLSGLARALPTGHTGRGAQVSCPLTPHLRRENSSSVPALRVRGCPKSWCCPLATLLPASQQGRPTASPRWLSGRRQLPARHLCHDSDRLPWALLGSDPLVL